ncbi:MAG TPA: pyridoxal phosphate-dependent aminotransferase [Sedimentisphaerales bacterium]|nr:pyridoxal phosphate-dependent aminotransferase [Sedimentisphaerales bacterium]
MRESLRMQSVQSPIIPVVGELIRANPGTISLGQGVAYYGPPPQAVEAIQRFLADPENHKYKLVQGIPELLEAIERKGRQENGISLEGSRIVVTAGANMGFMNAVLAIADPGDEIILQLPYYFNHEMAVAIADCKAVCVPTDKDYQLQPEAIAAAITRRTRAVVTISPNNPTGAVYRESDLRRVNEICRRSGVYHISDEAYEYFTYDGAMHFSPASIAGSAGHTISLFSLSKAYGFASWRIGWMVIPEHLYMPIKKIQDTILICPPVISQWAAVGAMEAGRPYCLDKLKMTTEIRRIFLDELAGIADLVTVPPADGAFYLLMRVHKNSDPMELVAQLIERHKVAVIPGTTFGMEDKCYLRVAYGALQKDTAAEGIGRLVRGLKQILAI